MWALCFWEGGCEGVRHAVGLFGGMERGVCEHRRCDVDRGSGGGENFLKITFSLFATFQGASCPFTPSTTTSAHHGMH